MKQSVTLKNFYDEHYKGNVDWETYRYVIKTFNYLLMKTLIETGDTYKFPKRLGNISIKKHKGGGRFFANNHYTRTGEKKFFKNKHSDGYYARFHWEKNDSTMLLSSSTFWKFVPLRYHKRTLAQHIFNNSIHKYYG